MAVVMLFDVDGTLYSGNVNFAIIDVLHEIGFLSSETYRDVLTLNSD